MEDTKSQPSLPSPGQSGTFPVLPLRDLVVFPSMIAPLFVGRPRSVQALEEASRHKNCLFLVAQKNPQKDAPDENDIYKVGAVASILQLLKLPDGTMKVLVEGIARGSLDLLHDAGGYFEGSVRILQEKEKNKERILGLARSVQNRFETYAKLKKGSMPEFMISLGQVESPARLADGVASHVSMELGEKQKLLETLDVAERLERVYATMESEISVLQMERKIRGRVKRQVEKTQREYYLNEQMKAIQKELGESDDGRDDLSMLEERIQKTKLSKEAREKAKAEIKRLRQMGPMSAEATVVRNYLDWILSIPWGKKARAKTDLAEAQKVLDADHYGLEKVKERIIEYLAVQQRVSRLKGPILCLVGPPGVGKTSLGRSVARATGRPFLRMSLGGVRDEAEIRGHRRTYIGSMPGRVIQSMKKVKYTNPLFLLDEVDKMGVDFRGDPSAALLEVLDPEQNATFNDHYLEVDYDLSNVMFITTANTMNIPPALLDRMETLRIPGYTEDEKMEIATRHLIPKAVEAHGLKKDEWSLGDSALADLIRVYTREAGVRNLEREIQKLARKTVRDLVMGRKTAVRISRKNLESYAGVPKYRHEEIDKENRIGVANGMAWTQFGGELLTIEGVMASGKGRMTITGNLRDVMKESISAAKAYVHARAPEFGIKPSLFEKKDIHVHVPEAATPKDGPSAGIAIVAAIVSLMTDIPVRRDVAMTGEITLRGRVLPIGGLKEKLLAALRAGVKKVLIPDENVRDLSEIPDKIKNKLEIVPIASASEMLVHGLTREPTPIPWDEKDAPLPSKDKKPLSPSSRRPVAH